MGNYTTNFNFYKPDPTEFIDVETQLNRNWDIADDVVKRLLEYVYTTETVPDIVDSVSRSKFFKSYSNSIYTYFKSGNFFWQGPSTPVAGWAVAKNWLSSGWTEHPDLPLFTRINRRLSGATKTEVEWTGALWMDGSNIAANTTIIVMPDGSIPTTYRPARHQYFNVWAANTSSDYSIARVFISDAGRMEIRRYGATSPGPIELTGIKYDLNVTG